jgi:adenylate kinase family enzyme
MWSPLDASVKDDREETVVGIGCEVYRELTEPLVAYYDGRSGGLRVDGDRPRGRGQEGDLAASRAQFGGVSPV